MCLKKDYSFLIVNKGAKLDKWYLMYDGSDRSKKYVSFV